MAASLPLNWIDAPSTHIVPSGYRGMGRRIYPDFLQYPSLILGQPERRLFLLFDYMQSLGGAVTYWQHATPNDRSHASAPMLDMPPEFILDNVRVVFQQTLRPKGMWQVASGRAYGRFESITRDPLADH